MTGRAVQPPSGHRPSALARLVTLGAALRDDTILRRRRGRRLRMIADNTASFVTFYDAIDEKSWTVPVVAWEARRRVPLVMDQGTAELVTVNVDPGADRLACVWSASTLYEGQPMSAARAEMMLRGWDDS